MLLAESAAIVEWILARHGGGRLRHGADHPAFAHYLYWFHFANGNLQPSLLRAMTISRSGLTADHPAVAATRARLVKVLDLNEARLTRHSYLAGSDFTAADIMSVFSLTTMREFYPVDLAPYPSIRAYLKRIGSRPAYQRAMANGDPDLTPLLS